MMPENMLSPKEAQRRLLLAYGKGSAGSFKEFSVRPFLNPVDQRDEKGHRRAHPLAVIGGLLLIVGLIGAFFFHF
jgi:hypothetical protein